MSRFNVYDCRNITFRNIDTNIKELKFLHKTIFRVNILIYLLGKGCSRYDVMNCNICQCLMIYRLVKHVFKDWWHIVLIIFVALLPVSRLITVAHKYAHLLTFSTWLLIWKFYLLACT